MFLWTVGCGVECVKGVILNKTEEWFNNSLQEAYHIDIIVRSDTTEQSNAGAACLMEVMKHGSFWPFNSSLEVQMPPDNTYVKDCLNASKGLPWNFCEPLCYRMYLDGDFRCCDIYPNRCYYWNCKKYKDACWQNYTTYCDGKLPGCLNVPACRDRLDPEWMSHTLTLTETLSLSISQTLEIEVRGAPPADDLISRLGESWLWLIIIVCIVAGLLICFIVAFLLYRRRKKQKKKAAEEYSKLGEELLIERGAMASALSPSSPTKLGQEEDHWDDLELESDFGEDDDDGELSDFELDVEADERPAASAIAVGAAAAGASADGFSSALSSGGGGFSSKKSGSSGFDSSDAFDNSNDEKDSFFSEDNNNSNNNDEDDDDPFGDQEVVSNGTPVNAGGQNNNNNNQRDFESDSFFESSDGGGGRGNSFSNNESFGSHSSDDL